MNSTIDDDEGVDVPLAAVAERVFRRGPRLARLPPSSSRPWLPESATEWIDSASIDDDPVSRKATNLVTAMPRLAASAAMIALLPPSVLSRSAPGGRGGEIAPDQRASPQFGHGDHGRGRARCTAR